MFGTITEVIGKVMNMLHGPRLAATTLQPEPQAPPIPKSGFHILIADEECHIAKLIQINLQREGYSVESAFSAEEVLEKIRAHLPDLMLLESAIIESSEIFDLLMKMRSCLATGDLPLIAIIGRGRVLQKIGQLHLRNAIWKPFNPKEVVYKVNRFSGR